MTDKLRARPTIELRPIDRRKQKSMWLHDHKRDVKTANGEDGIIEKIFEVIGTRNKFVVDFGAADGIYYSNSWNLLNNHGWRGLLLEPDFQYSDLEKTYQDRDDVFTKQDIVGFEDTNNLDAHLASLPTEVPQDFDFLSIDIDGNDLHVWMDIKNYRPRAVCVEFNHFIPHDVYLLQPRDESLCIGSSLLTTVEVGQDLGYELIAVVGSNAFLVAQEEFPKFGIEDNSIEAMAFLGKHETKLIQAYDGTIYLAGLTVNPWKGHRLDEENMQPLPSNMRQWKFPPRKIWPIKKL